MPFVRIEGFKGLVFVPEENSRPKKHPCPDCFSCQFCSDERCDLCLKRRRCRTDEKPGTPGGEGSCI